MISEESLLEVLDLSEESITLLSVRHSSRSKRLIFKTSIRIGFEIILPRFYDDNWVLDVLSRKKYQIEKDLAAIRKGRTKLKHFQNGRLPEWALV